jgi:opacity protein-like surface antigen
MNKKFMIGGCAAVAIAGNVFAADEDISYFNPYASLKGGYAFLSKRNDIKYKGGFAGAVELGVSYDDAWRLGLELGYKSNKIKDFKPAGNFEGTNYILNGTVDWGHGELNIDTVGDGVTAAQNVITNDRSIIRLTDNNVNGAGLPALGIAVADWTALTGSAAPVANDHGLALRKASYLKLEKMNTLTGMFNVCYDYAMTDAWSIYGGFGLGVARVNYTVTEGHNSGTKLIAARAAAGGAYDAAAGKALVLEALPNFVTDLHKTEYSKTVFAWQLMAGVGYEFNENWKLTLGYKLFNTAKVKQTFAGKEYKIKTPFNHTAEVGLTYSF